MMKRDRHSGKIINDRYELLTLIDEGGMGAVYLGRDILLGRRAAVKFLHAELTAGEAAVKRFYREGQAASAVNHPNIISVFDVGVSEWGEPFLVMEYLSGENLGSILKRKKQIDLAAALGIMEPALRGLGAAHDQNIVHRDLKPENIFLVRMQDGPPIVKLIDFGVSKVVETGEPHLTKTGAMLGTPSYMSPEQARGKGNFDHRADLYSMGVILYLMLSGGHPFVGESYNDLIFNILTEPPRDPLSLYADFPRAVLPIIEKLLDKDAKNRYPDCKSLLSVLETLEGFERRTEALIELARDMVPERFNSADFESPFDGLKESDDLAATVFAKAGPDETVAADPESIETERAPTQTPRKTADADSSRERDVEKRRPRESDRELSWDMIPSQVPPPRVKKDAKRSAWPTFLLLFLLFCGGAAVVLGWDMIFAPNITAPDRNPAVVRISDGGGPPPSSDDEPLNTEEGTQPQAPVFDEEAASDRTGSESEKPKDTGSTDGAAALKPGVTPLNGVLTPPSTEPSNASSPEHSKSAGQALSPSKNLPPAGGTVGGVAPVSEPVSSPKDEKASSSKDENAPPVPSPAPSKEGPEKQIPGDPNAPLTPHKIDYLLDLKTAKIQNCYDMARISDPSLKGRLVLVVGMGGEDVNVSVEKNELSPYLASCVKRVIGNIKPPPNNGHFVEIQKEFVFEVAE